MLKAEPHPLLWNKDDYYRLADLGFFDEKPRVELLEGEIVQLSPQNRRHQMAIGFGNNRLVELFGSTHIVYVQCPIDLGSLSQPEPDFALVPIQQAQTAVRHPTHPDLVIEVSDASLRYDRGRKLKVYLQAGIPEVWLVNLKKSLVEVYRGS